VVLVAVERGGFFFFFFFFSFSFVRRPPSFLPSVQLDPIQYKILISFSLLLLLLLLLACNDDKMCNIAAATRFVWTKE